jgi:hypothetical protein
MYVEILDGRYAGQMRDMEPGAAMDLINVGRAKRYGEPTLATPPLPGGYSGTPVSGGIAEDSPTLVGEHAGETILPRTVAEKFRKPKHR